MKLFHIALLIMIMLTFMACGSNPSNPAIKSETGPTVEVQNEPEISESSETPESSEPPPSLEIPGVPWNSRIYKDFTIGIGTASHFCINAAMPEDSSYGYLFAKKEETRVRDGEPYTIISYEGMKDGERHLALLPLIRPDGSEGAWIQEMMVYSDLYKTKNGIGIGNTIEEFYFTFDDAEAVYTYYSGSYWLETEEFPGVQFMIKEGDYTENPGYHNDPIKLDKRKFKKNAKIEYIRLYSLSEL